MPYTTNNNATGKESKGGAIYNEDGKITIKDSTLAGNSADEGGAVYTSSERLVDAQNCKFENNKPDDIR